MTSWYFHALATFRLAKFKQKVKSCPCCPMAAVAVAVLTGSSNEFSENGFVAEPKLRKSGQMDATIAYS